jgi:hypothetical protein
VETVIGLRGRIDRLNGRLGFEPDPRFAIVSIGCESHGRPPRPAVERYDGGWVGCHLPEPTRELAEELVRLNSLGYFGVELRADAGEGPDEWAALRRLVLAAAADDHQRRTLEDTPAWDLLWDGYEQEEWLNRLGTRDESP